MCSSQEKADKLTKPSRGDHWINGLLLDGQDFEFPANFSNSFPSFPKNAALVASPSKGACYLISLLLVIKVLCHRKSSIKFSLHLSVAS